MAVKLPAGKLSTVEIPPFKMESVTPQTVPPASVHVTEYGAFPPVGETNAVAELSPKQVKAVSVYGHNILYISKFNCPAFSK